MRTKSCLIGAASVVASLAMIGGVAQAASVVVLGQDGIWLAGQPAGAFVSGFFGSDTAPANSPVQINLTAPTLTFSATGSTSVDDSCFAGPGGGCYGDQSSFSPSPWDGLYNGPADALLGIFLGPAAPTLGTSGGFQGPLSFVAGPDYQNPANLGPGAYSPALDQIFIIGDGAGETFTAPSGATRLFLGVADSLGGSAGNLGALTVDVTGGTAAVPEPAAWAIMLLGLGGMGVVLRSRRSRLGDSRGARAARVAA
jgi:hypothetical protein